MYESFSRALSENNFEYGLLVVTMSAKRTTTVVFWRHPNFNPNDKLLEQLITFAVQGCIELNLVPTSILLRQVIPILFMMLKFISLQSFPMSHLIL